MPGGPIFYNGPNFRPNAIHGAFVTVTSNFTPSRHKIGLGDPTERISCDVMNVMTSWPPFCRVTKFDWFYYRFLSEVVQEAAEG